MLIHTLALLRKTLLAYCTIFQLSYLPIKKTLITFAENYNRNDRKHIF